jgi:hypothetical protein
MPHANESNMLDTDFLNVNESIFEESLGESDDDDEDVAAVDFENSASLTESKMIASKKPLNH